MVLDNGGCTIKAGLASNPAGVRCAFAALACALPRNADAPLPARRCSCVPNCTAKPKSEKRLYVGDEVDELRDISAVSIRRPVDRGFVVNLPLQKDIWERTLRRALKARARFPQQPRRPAAAPRGGNPGAVAADAAPPQVDPTQHSLLVTEPLFNLPALMARPRSRVARVAPLRPQALTRAAVLLLRRTDAVRRAHLRAVWLSLRAHRARARAGRARPAFVRRRCGIGRRGGCRLAGAAGCGAGGSAARAHHAGAGLRLLIHVRPRLESLCGP